MVACLLLVQFLLLVVIECVSFLFLFFPFPVSSAFAFVLGVVDSPQVLSILFSAPALAVHFDFVSFCFAFSIVFFAGVPVPVSSPHVLAVSSPPVSATARLLWMVWVMASFLLERIQDS